MGFSFAGPVSYLMPLPVQSSVTRALAFFAHLEHLFT